MTNTPKNFSLIDANGCVLMVGCSTELPALAAGQQVVLEHPPSIEHYRSGNAWVARPARPSPKHVFDWSVKAWTDPRTLDALRADQMRAVDAAFARAADALTAGYPAAEQMTWPMQQAEAQAWALNPGAPTPYLDGIARERGIDAQAMRQKTLENVNAFRAASQKLIGQRQALRDAIARAATREAVLATVWTD